MPAPQRSPLGGLISLLGTPLILLTGAALGLSDDITLKGLGIAIAGVAIGLKILTAGPRALDPLGPAALITYSHVLLFVLRPGYSYLYQDSTNLFTQAPYDDDSLSAQLLATAGYIGLCVGLRLGSRQSSLESRKFSNDPRSDKSAGPFLWLVVAIGFALYGIYIRTTGLQAFLAILRTGRSAESAQSLEGSSAYFYAGLSVATGALLLIFMLALHNGKRLSAIFSIVLLTISALPSFASGTRSAFIPTLVAVLIILRSRYPKAFSIRRLIAFFPFAFIALFIAPRMWRVGLAQGGSLGQSLSDALLPQNYLEGFVGSYDTAMLDAFSLQVHAQASNVIPLQYGKTYLSLLVALVPRDIWPGKPITVDQILNAYLFPATSSKNIGFSFGFYSEPYLNFDVVGVVGVSLLFGLLLEKLVSRSIASSDLLLRYCGIMATTYMLTLMRGSISFDLQRLLIAIVPTVIAVWIARKLAPQKNVRGSMVGVHD